MNLILAIREWLFDNGPTSYLLCVFGLPILFSYRWLVARRLEKQAKVIATATDAPKGSFSTWCDREVVTGRELFRLGKIFFASLVVTIGFGVIAEAMFHNRHDLIPAYTLVTNGQGKVARIFRHDEYVPHSESVEWRLNGYRDMVSFAPSVSTIKMSVSPITENPKVMRIGYTIEIQTVPNVSGFVRIWKEGGFTKAEKFVEMQLFDFQFAHSRELAKFNNPLRSEQQNEFRKLVLEFLKPKIEDSGIKIRSINFNLP
ncbi:MAG: hypothetical protein AAB511_03955 [Patescibacteria group bacterium]